MNFVLLFAGPAARVCCKEYMLVGVNDSNDSALRVAVASIHGGVQTWTDMCGCGNKI